MSARLPAAKISFGTLLAVGLLLFSGCATTGPNHVYVTTANHTAIVDLSATGRVTLPAASAEEQVQGLAYEFNLDHLFIRVRPGQLIRVIKRSTGTVLREMPLPDELQADGSADLAIRSRDRHLFAVHPDGHSVVELTLQGKIVRRIEFPASHGPVGGLAVDQRQSRLLALAGQAVRAYDFSGRELGSVTLQASLQSISLGYNSEAGHYFVPLADGHTLGEFDENGRLVASHETGSNAPITAVDAGQRSYVRVF